MAGRRVNCGERERIIDSAGEETCLAAAGSFLWWAFGEYDTVWNLRNYSKNDFRDFEVNFPTLKCCIFIGRHDGCTN